MAKAYKRARKSLRDDRLGDYAVTQDVMDAIFGNLQTTTNKLSRSMQGFSARETQRLKLMAKNSAGGARGTLRREQQGVTKTFGTGFEGVARIALRPAKAQSEERVRNNELAARNATAAKTTLKTTMGLLSEGRADARTAADYMLNKALYARASDDEKFVAGLAAEERMARLNAELQYNTWRKQQDYLQKLEDDEVAQGNDGYRGMTVVANHMTNASSHLRAMFAADETLSVQAAVQKYAQDFGAASPEEMLVLQALASAIKTGHIYGGVAGRQAEIDAILDSMLQMYPGFRGRRKDLEKVVAAQLQHIYTSGTGAPEQGGGNILAQTLQAFPDFGLEAVSGGNAYTETYNGK